MRMLKWVRLQQQVRAWSVIRVGESAVSAEKDALGGEASRRLDKRGEAVRDGASDYESTCKTGSGKGAQRSEQIRIVGAY